MFMCLCVCFAIVFVRNMFVCARCALPCVLEVHAGRAHWGCARVCLLCVYVLARRMLNHCGGTQTPPRLQRDGFSAYFAVPVASAGVIIGRGGTGIAAIGAATGATLRLAPRGPECAGVPERGLLVQGDLHAVVAATRAIAEIFVANPFRW
jgi:hypothetical protein